jgi:ATP-binding cassette, subfamily B, bacterial AbcA/BmrA
MHTWKIKLNNYGLPDSIIFLIFVIAILSAIAEIFSIGMFLPLFELINQQGADGLEGSNSDIVVYMHNLMQSIGLNLTVEVLLSLSFILFLSSKVFLYISTYIQSYYSGLMTKNMKDKLLNSYLQVMPSYYDTVSLGDFSNSSSVELPLSVSGVMLPIKLAVTTISGIGSTIFLFIMSPQLTLLTMGIVGVVILLPYRWVKATTIIGKKNSNYSSIVTSFLLNRLQSPRLVRLSNTSIIEGENYFFLTEKHRQLTLAIHILKARITLALEPMIIGISLLMFYAALMVFKMSVSSILLYMVVMVRIVPIVTNILTQKQSMNRAVGPIHAIERLLNNMNASISNRKNNISKKNPITAVSAIKTLRLKNTCYRYKDCLDDTLSNINYIFKESTLIAIVGPSGSGKTTFVDLISGYRQPTSGSIFINGINIDKYNPESLMSLVSYVPQSPQIFDRTTVYEHIVYGNLNPAKSEVINATKLSGAYDFIKELPQGFDTVLTGGFSGLSGGQKQRLDLARALLKNTPVLIMDEPTGSLDLISEKEIMLNINKIRNETKKIIIIIAHRMHTIIDAEQIIVLEGGEISGVGTHSELLLRNSWYKRAASEL